MKAGIPGLLGFDIQFLRQPPVFFVLFVYEPGELRAAAADRLLVGFEKMLPDGGISERLADLAIEAVNDRGRRAGRNEHADPLVDDQSLDRCSRGDCGIDEPWRAMVVSLAHRTKAAANGERKGSPRRATHEYAAE